MMEFEEKKNIALFIVEKTGKVNTNDIEDFISMLEDWQQENPASVAEIPDE